MRKYDSIYHKSMVDNWRRMANIPDTVSDIDIYNKVEELVFHVSSSKTNEENNEELNALRQEFNLPERELGSYEF